MDSDSGQSDGRLGHGALGAIALLTFILGGTWLFGEIGALPAPLLTWVAAALGIGTADSVGLGVLAFCLFTLPLLVLAVVGMSLVWRGGTRSRIVGFGSLAIALLVDRFGLYSLDETTPRHAFAVYSDLSLAAWGVILAVAAVWLFVQKRAIDRQATIFMEEDRQRENHP